jgi:Protein of unknown function (DUF4236)
VSLSFGVRGAHYTIGPRGQRVTVGATGTGLFWTQWLPATATVYQGGMMRSPLYALADALGTMPVPVRAVMVVTLVILGAFGLLVGVEAMMAALRIG